MQIYFIYRPPHGHPNTAKGLNIITIINYSFSCSPDVRDE